MVYTLIEDGKEIFKCNICERSYTNEKEAELCEKKCEKYLGR